MNIKVSIILLSEQEFLLKDLTIPTLKTLMHLPLILN